MQRNEWRGCGLGLAAAVIWGGYLAVSRAAVLHGLEAADIASLRFLVAGACFLPWLLFGGRKAVALASWRMLLLAFLIGPPFVLLGVGGFAFAPLAHAALLQPAALLAGSLVFSRWLLGESLAPRRIVALTIVLSGLGITFWPGAGADGSSLPGDAMFILSALMWALFASLQRRWRIGSVTATAAVSLLSAAVMLPACLLAGVGHGLLALPLAELLLQAVVQGLLVGVIAILAFTKSVALLGAGRAAFFPALVPALALVIGIPVAGEVPSPAQWVGLAVVSSGLLLGVVGPRPRGGRAQAGSADRAPL